MNEILFALGMLLSVLVGRTQLLAMRAHIPDRSGLMASLIGIVSGLSFFAILVWGFATIAWYSAIGLALGMALLSGFLVDRNFAVWYQLKALVDAATVGLTVYLWFGRWPF